MYSLSNQQIDYILNDIRARGVETEDLQLNLLDHICCVIESELEEKGDFEGFYRQTIQRFYQKELKELEEETQLLLTFKHYYTMKKIMFVSGFASAFLMLFGAYFKIMHWPGANVMLIIGMLVLSLVFFPLLFTLKLKEKSEKKEKAVLILGLFASVYLLIGALFKFMHWPGAGFFVLTGIPFLLFVYLPVYLVSGLRNPEKRVNTIVTSILIIAGSGFLMVLPNRSNVYHIPARLNHLNNEEQILSRMEKMVAADTGQPEIKKAFDDFMLSANRLKDRVAQLCSGMEYKAYLEDLAPGTEASYTFKLREFPETRNYIQALLQFEEKANAKVFSFGDFLEFPVPNRDAQVDYLIVTQPNVKDLLGTIINTQEQACLALVRGA